jgi:hypothetical protein
MAVAAYALTTLAQAKTELGVVVSTHDAVIERLIDTVSSAAAEFCERTLHYQTGIAERVAGYGGQLLYVSRTPIISITSIELLPSSLSVAGTGTTYAATSYTVRNANAGIIFRQDGWQWTANFAERLTSAPLRPGTEDTRFLVTYAGGYVTRPQGGSVNLPPDIEQAVLWGIANLWRHRGREIHAQVETEDAATIEWKSMVLPKASRDLLMPYKRVR